MRRFLSSRGALCLCAVTMLPLQMSAQSNVKVAGLGLLGNMEMDRRLAFLSGVQANEPQSLDYYTVEDIAYVLLQIMKKEGHPGPQVTGKIEYEDGAERELTWSLPFSTRVDDRTSESKMTAVTFDCDPGLLDYYQSVEITGVETIDERLLADFFIPSGVLFTRRKHRSFTGSNLDSRLNRLLAAIRSHGYLQAEVVERNIQRDSSTGAVSVEIEIEEGSIHEIGSVSRETSDAEGNRSTSSTMEFQGEILNNAWINDHRQSIYNELYTNGYPDARVRVAQARPVAESSGRIRVDLEFRVETGPRVKLGGVEFKPEGLLKESVLKRQTNLRKIENYNLLAVEEGRRQLLSLGVFDDVELDHVKLDEGSRKAVYTMDPSPRKTFVLLLGYGSYELGRIGFNWEHINLWGRAHRYEIEMKKSFKAFNFDGTYVVPHFFDKRITAYFRTGYEFREEISYDRTTSEAVFGANRKMEIPGLDISVEYAFEKHDTTRGTEADFESLDRATVSSISLRTTFDRRDSVLYPTRGYDLRLVSKTATEAIGGDSNFQAVGFSASYHKFLGNAFYVHVGIDYGTIFSQSPTSENLPFNERFFPGGENSVRGYKRGEATSLTVEGEPIGSETFALANIELEQRVLRNFSIILFWDGVVIEQEQATIPGEEFLQSVGLGLRWRTVVGPVRLEYGHNIDPRPFDPDGTLHLSVGFPF